MRVLFTYSGAETDEQLYWARRLTLDCLEAGMEVDSLAPLGCPSTEGEKRFDLKLPGRHRQGWGFWFCVSIILPFQLFLLAFVRGYSAVVSCESYISFLSSVLFPFRKTTRCLIIRQTPWKRLSRKRFSLLSRNFLYFRDCFGLMSAHRVVVPTRTTAEEITAEISLLGSFVSVIPFSTTDVRMTGEATTDGSLMKNENPRDYRDALLARYDLPEKTLLMVTSDDSDDRSGLERFVRAISAADQDRICLFVLGSSPDRVAVVSIIIGLGLLDRIIFVDDPLEWEVVVRGSDMYVLCSEQHGMTRFLMLAFAMGIPVIGVDSPEIRELLGDDRLLFSRQSVEEIAQQLRAIASTRAKYTEIKELSTRQAESYESSWSEQVITLL